jgi:uncharacterized membrane protein
MMRHGGLAALYGAAAGAILGFVGGYLAAGTPSWATIPIPRSSASALAVPTLDGAGGYGVTLVIPTRW